VLNGIAGLIAAVAGLITAVTGLVGMLVVARRTSPKERGDAADSATERALNPPSQVDADSGALVEIAGGKRKRRRRDR
jgi:hypothetical protein